MNVIFHIVAGTGIVATMSHLKVKDQKVGKIASGFFLGLISHGILDYSPHCYPINSKVDFLLGLLLIATSIFFVKKEWKLIVTAIYFGCVFPDLIDLSPEIINSQLGFNLPTFENIFPWHIHEYSGSIYSGECEVSSINHILTFLFCGIAVFLNKNSLKEILK